LYKSSGGYRLNPIDIEYDPNDAIEMANFGHLFDAADIWIAFSSIGSSAAVKIEWPLLQ